MTQYAVFMYGPTDAEESRVCGPEYDQHSEDVTDSGTMVAAFDLAPATTAVSIHGDVVVDGPFIEAKEVIVGFYVIEAPDLDAALGVARLNPILGDGGGLEVRRVAQSSVRARPAVSERGG